MKFAQLYYFQSYNRFTFLELNPVPANKLTEFGNILTQVLNTVLWRLTRWHSWRTFTGFWGRM